MVLSTPVASTDPAMVQFSSFSAGGDLTKQRNVPLAYPVLSGNAVFVTGALAQNSSPTITDDQGNTYTINKVQDDIPNIRRTFFASCLNVTNAPRTIILTNSGVPVQWLRLQVSEWCNIALSSAFNVSNSATGTSSTPTPGSITTTTANELVFTTVSKNGGSNMSQWTHGTGQTLLMADVVDGLAVQFSVKAVAGAISTTLPMDASYDWGALVVSFKQASAGTPRPAGLRIIGIHHQGIREKTGTSGGDYSAGNYIMQAPCFGTFLYGAYDGLHDISTITDNFSNTWTPTGASVSHAPGQGPVRCFHVAAPTGGDSIRYTCALTSSGSVPGDTILIFDCQGVNASTLVHATANNTQAAGTTLATASVTPPSANGIVFHTYGHGDNTTLSVASPLVFVTSIDPLDETSPWWNDENNGWAYHLNSTTAASQATWTSDFPVGDWASIADAYGPS